MTPDDEGFHEGVRNRDICGCQIFRHHVRIAPNKKQIYRLWNTHETQHEEAGYQKTTSGESASLAGTLQRVGPDADETQIEPIPSDREIQVYANRIYVKIRLRKTVC